MWNLRFVVGVLSCAVIVLSPTPIVQAQGIEPNLKPVEKDGDNSPSFSIVVLGRSGSGVSSTVQELIGPLTQCPLLEWHPTLNPKILEYTLRNIASSNGSEKYSFKLIEVPELVENSTLKEEAEIFASLKAYLQNDNLPKIFLVLSSFVDEDFENENSKFIPLLQRVQFFQQSFLSEESSLSSTGTMFLLSHLMDERKLWQTRPQAKVMVFRAIVEEFTSFPLPILISVGESRSQKVITLRKESGYHVLPNKELFPKNLWENILSMSSAWNNSQVVQNTITTFMKEGRVSKNVVCDIEPALRDWKFLNEDVEDFAYFLERNLNWSIADNEINREIDQVFSTFPQHRQHQGSLQKIALQIRLQDLGIETRADLPTTHLERMKLLDKIPLGVGAIILKKQFGLKMPEYKHHLSVGFGYNLLKDEALTSTPFKKEFLMPNSLGYQFPAFVNCTRMPEERQECFAEIVDSYSHYVSERLKSLHLPENFVPASEFRANIRAGFNIKEEHKDNTTMLSVLKEIRKVKCTLQKSIILQRGILTDEFQDAVNNITKFKFDQTSRESVNAWRTFFERFGSHIVSSSYGGGYLDLDAEVSVNGSDEELTIMLQKIKSQFNPRINSEIQIDNKWESGVYSFHGGNLNSREDDLSKLETTKLNKLLGSWATSLTNDFVMLNHDIELQPISFVVRLHNETMGEIVSMALTKLLNGELRYVERKEVEAWKDEAPWWSLASDDGVDPSVGWQAEDDLLKNMPIVSSSSCGGLLDSHSGWVNFSADALRGKDTPSSCVWTIRANNHELIKLKAKLSVVNNNSQPVLNARVVEIIHDMKNGSIPPQIIATRLLENEPQIYFGPVIFVVLSRVNESDGCFQLQFEGIGDGNSAEDHQTLFKYKTFEGSFGSLNGTDLESLSSSVMELNDTESTKNYVSTFVSVVFPNGSTNVQLEALLGERNERCSAGSSFIVLSHIEENSPRLRDCCKSDRRGGKLMNKYDQPFLVIIRKTVEESMDFNLTWRRWTRRDKLNSGIGSWSNVTVQNNHCGGVVIGKEGQLKYKLDWNYYDNERCLWLLHSPTSSNITITLMQNGFEECCDYIVVYTVDPGNGRLGNEFRILPASPPVIFVGSVLAILFRSDGSKTGNGFHLRFTGNGDNINPEYIYKLRHTSPNEITKFPDWDWEDDDDGEGKKETTLIASKLVPGPGHYSMDAWQTDINKFVGTSLSKSRTSCTFDNLNFYNASLSTKGYNITNNYPLPGEQLSCPNKIKIPDMKDVFATDIPGVLAIYKRVQDPVDSMNLWD